jgi:putative tryptophan/tyrosine transport system substrate-binding protein
MDRRTVVCAVAVGLVFTPTVAFAQQPATVHRIGFLGAETASYDQARLNSLRESLRELGYVEGRNLVIEVRVAEGNYDRLPILAAELVARKVDVLVTSGVKATHRCEQHG